MFNIHKKEEPNLKSYDTRRVCLCLYDAYGQSIDLAVKNIFFQCQSITLNEM